MSRRALPRPRTWLGRRRHVSLLLLEELAAADDVQPELYDRLFGFACMPNRVWKRTRRGRMVVLDATVLGLLRQRFARGARLLVNDLAASTGVTSVEFFRVLAQAFDVDLVASDLYRDLVAVCSRRRPLAVIFDESGAEIQYVAGRFVLPGQIEESAVYPVNRLVKSLVRQHFVPDARGILAGIDAKALRPFESREAGPYRVVRMPMLTREALDTLRGNDRFRFETWDILAPMPRRAHVVRAMNILNADYFDDEQRTLALRHCVDAVVPGGLFVVGWSPTPEPETVEASVYRVEGGRLERLVSLNEGSEIDRLIARTFPVTDADAGVATAGANI